MSSLHTNLSSITALQALRASSKTLGKLQTETASGLRIAEASDNAAYWAISVTMRSDAKVLNAVQDMLAMSAALMGVTSTAVASSIEITGEITAKLALARNDSVDKDKINAELSHLKSQLQSNIEAASFNGENWLVWNDGGDSVDKELTSSFTRDQAGNVRLGKITYPINTPPPRSDTDIQYFVDNGGSGEYGILSSEAFAVLAGSATNYVLIPGSTAPVSAVELSINNATTNAELDDMILTVEAMTRQMIAVASKLGSITSRIEIQKEFTQDLVDSIARGTGQLVDADMGEVSARLEAEQVRQQLGIQALSIANETPKSILQLFG